MFIKDDLKKKFVRDVGVPIKVLEEPYFSHYLDLYEEEFQSKCTDYFYDYDYIVGDIAYGKLRLKGFYHSSNKKANKINDYKNLETYLETNCAVDCRHFILKKDVK